MSPMPITRVVLYKHGVGYFEREGKVDGDATLALTFKQAEVSDVLKSLTVLDLDGGHIAFSLAEGVHGRAIPRAAYERASAIGIIVVLFLFFIGLTNDVNRIRGG